MSLSFLNAQRTGRKIMILLLMQTVLLFNLLIRVSLSE